MIASFDVLAAPIAAADVALVPLSTAHADALANAFVDDELWTWLLLAKPQTRADVDAWIASALAAATRREAAPFVVVRPDGTLAGTTRFLAIRPGDASLEIGSTMLFANARGTWINSRVKAMMLERAFGCGYQRVELRTDARNDRSRAAITAIGATYEGTLRSLQRRADGRIRDTAVFSVLAREWLDVRQRLASRAARFMEKI